MNKSTKEEALSQAKKLMALKPKKRFKLPYLDCVGTDKGKATLPTITP